MPRLSLAILLFLSILHSAFAASRPNIILIMTDDQGYGEMSCHGNPILKTPYLDQVHRESVRFTDFSVSPTCAPTRASLLTGRHEFQNGVTHTILERERLTLSATTLPQVLSAAGYKNGIFGKWHLGDEPQFQPERRGFDEVFIHGGGGIGQTYPGSCGDAPQNKYFDPAILHNGRFVQTKGYCTDVFFSQALQWIAERHKSRQPFFAYITPNAPHDPFVSPGAEYDQLFEGSGLTPNQIAYYAMIKNIDDNIGRLLKSLRDLGLESDTLLIFMTDNGHSNSVLFNAGMRGSKGTVYQGGVRVPSFWRWPGQLQPGDRPQMAAHIDVLPTLAQLAAARLDKDLVAQVEGKSLVPLLRDANAPWPDRMLITHLGRWPTGRAAEWKHKQSAIRNERYKWVNNTELYDLEEDPAESRNVLSDHPDLVAAFRQDYDQWWAKVIPKVMENEFARGPAVNSFKQRYWAQFGGGPTPELLQQMDPERKFSPAK